MSQALRSIINDRLRGAGPLTFAEFMELALYHPEHGYYARAARRSGRAGDFFTSVDVGPEFGALVVRQFAEMWALLSTARSPALGFDLVEAAAGDGRLMRDVLDAAVSERSDRAAAGHSDGFYDALRVHLVEPSAAARAAQVDTLGPHCAKIASRTADLPDTIEGVIFANELLDALPTHAVVMREDGLREMYVDCEHDRLIERELAPSTPALQGYLDAVGADLRPGWRAEIGLAAVEWIRDAARRLRRGFLLLIDYGHEAAELYSATHAAGTRTSFARHMATDADMARAPWLDAPGDRDITAHVDLTTVTRTAEAEGLITLGRIDQTYFLLGLGLADMLQAHAGSGAADLKKRLALKTLMMPGALGSTLKVLIFGKHVGHPALRACSYRNRLT